jgi:SAM-dependent methyltransferase
MLRRLLKKLRRKSLAATFHDIYYDSGRWRSEETGSGPGSTLESTRHIREMLPQLLQRIDAKHLLDAPCGDFNWMNHVALGDIRYTGVDIVPGLVKENQKKYPDREFIVADITKDTLPPADVVLSRDCFIHLPNSLILSAMANFKKSGIKYMLTNTYDFIQQNEDVEPGDFRMINLRLAPFSLPEPLTVIEEEYTSGYPDKKLALWKL